MKNEMIKNRAEEKQRSRDRDLERLDNGEITSEQLRKENGFASCLDLTKFKIE